MEQGTSDARPAVEQQELCFDAPGCYRRPAFQERLAHQPEMLQQYAWYVATQSYSTAYLQRVRQVVPRLARWLSREVASDGRPGLCVQTSMLLSRLLEELGIWNYIAAGGCALSFWPADLRPRIFYLFDLKPVEVPHAWVVAPPFDVIDLTLRYQRYPGLEGQRIPAMVLSCRAPSASVEPEDVCTPALLQGLMMRGWPRATLLQQAFPGFWHFLQQFPARQVAAPGVHIKYIPARLLLPPWHESWETFLLINGKSFRQFRMEMSGVLEDGSC